MAVGTGPKATRALVETIKQQARIDLALQITEGASATQTYRGAVKAPTDQQPQVSSPESPIGRAESVDDIRVNTAMLNEKSFQRVGLDADGGVRGAPPSPTAVALGASSSEPAPLSGYLEGTTFVEAFSNMQPSLALTQVMPLYGYYPGRDGSGGSSEFFQLGQLRTFAGNFSFADSSTANGATLSIAQNTALFSIFGTLYGGNGQTTFRLPDLGGALAVGAGQGPGLSNFQVGEAFGTNTVTLTTGQMPVAAGGSGQAIDNAQESLALRWVLSVDGTYPSQGGGYQSSDMMGMLSQWGGDFEPSGFMYADGRELLISEWPTLYTILGTAYGGDGETTFRIPDLRGRVPVGADGNSPIGTVTGSELTNLTTANLPGGAGGSGVPVSNLQPTLAVTYAIAVQGLYPSRDSSAAPEEFYLGEVIAFAGGFVPSGFMAASGQVLPIAGNAALFSILGVTYGGNGQTNFALPNLNDRAVMGTGGPAPLGAVFGSTSTALTSANVINVAPDILDLQTTDTGAEQVYDRLDEAVDIRDFNLDRYNGGAGNYAGATLAIGRQGGANAQDAFRIDATDATFTVVGTDASGALQFGGLTFATYAQTGGVLTITFTSGQTAATSALVDAVASRIAYANQGDTPPASVPLTYTFRDGNTGSQGAGGAGVHVGAITVTFTSVNDAPVNTLPGAQAVNEDESFTLSTGNGNALSVADVDATTVTVTLSAAHGRLTLAGTTGLVFSVGDGTFDTAMTFSGTPAAINTALGAGLTYEPNADYYGADEISFSTSDNGEAGSGPAGVDSDTIAITVNAVNEEPAGADNAITVAEDGAHVFAAADFGFTDPDDDGLANVIFTTVPANGDIVIVDEDGLVVETLTAGDSVTAAQLAAGLVQYRPDTDEFGEDFDSFTFQVQDEGGVLNGGVDTDQSANTISITVTAVNDAPVAEEGSEAADVGTLIEGQLAATDVDDEIVSYALVGDPVPGLEIDPETGAYTFDSSEGFDDLGVGETREVTFQFTATDESGDESEPQTVTLTLTGVNATPVADTPDAVEVLETDDPVGGQLTATDSNDDAEDLIYALVDEAPAGFSLTSDGSWTFDPSAYELVDGVEQVLTIEYTVSDDQGASDTQTLTITVTGVNDAPVATAGSAAGDEGSVIEGQLVADDVDDAIVSYQLYGDPVPGLEIDGETGGYSFDASEGFDDLAVGETREVTFQFTATDEFGTSSAPQTVTLTVTGTNDEPVASAGSSSVEEDGSVSGSVGADDVDGDDLTYALDDEAPVGLTFNPDGSFTFDASSYDGLADGETTDIAFDYTVEDPTGAESTATHTITITGVNDAPTGTAGSGSVDEDGTLEGQLVADDVDDAIVSYQLYGDPVPGLEIDGETGGYSFDASEGFDDLAVGETREVTFQFTVTDEFGASSAPQTVTLTVTGTNDEPVASAGSSSVEEDGSVSGSVGADDVDGDDLTYALDDEAPVGLTFNTDGSFTFDASSYDGLAEGETTDIAFDYTVEDPTGAESTATHTITITGVNDAPTGTAGSGSVDEDATLEGQLVADDVDDAIVSYQLYGDPVPGLEIDGEAGGYSFDASEGFDVGSPGTELEFAL